MAPNKAISLGTAPIADHSFSSNRALLAVARDSNIELYYTNEKKAELDTTLTEHDKTVTSVDISPSGRLVTCSQDRNALVWEPQPDGTWKPTLVLLRINRAATFVRWSPDEKKFAVGSGANVIAVCYFEDENDWWISKHIKSPLDLPFFPLHGIQTLFYLLLALPMAMLVYFPVSSRVSMPVLHLPCGASVFLSDSLRRLCE